jgi:hypothetical protein
VENRTAVRIDSALSFPNTFDMCLPIDWWVDATDIILKTEEEIFDHVRGISSSPG